jgi:uncharacterized tellurite resistance protein B-like protein
MHALAQMKLLISLAKIDGSVAERERNYLINIGRANGLYPDQISALLQQQHEHIVPKNLTRDQKFEYIFSLIQLMKMDERMYQEELSFCSQIATKLGYERQVMVELLMQVKSGPMSTIEIETLKKSTEKYLH